MTSKELAKLVYAHAHKNYRHDGWDIIVECYSTDELIEAIGIADTLDAAIKNVRRIIMPVSANRTEVEAVTY